MNKQIFAKQDYQKFVREDALSLNVSTRNERAYNASPISDRTLTSESKREGSLRELFSSSLL